jgi:ribosomal protein S18 acetylase RimI-like enzyme
VPLQAYISHPWCRELQIRIGREQDLFQGLARLHLDTFSAEPVLLLSEDCEAAGILISGQQEAQLVAALHSTDFSVIAGTLQILQSMPEGRLPQLIRQLQQLQEGTAKAAAAAGHDSYLKLVCLGVRPAVQCQGFGRAVLGLALQQAQAQKQLLMADAAEPSAVQMLQRQGFTTVGSSGLCAQLAWRPL